MCVCVKSTQERLKAAMCVFFMGISPTTSTVPHAQERRGHFFKLFMGYTQNSPQRMQNLTRTLKRVLAKRNVGEENSGRMEQHNQKQGRGKVQTGDTDVVTRSRTVFATGDRLRNSSGNHHGFLRKRNKMTRAGTYKTGSRSSTKTDQSKEKLERKKSLGGC